MNIKISSYNSIKLENTSTYVDVNKLQLNEVLERAYEINFDMSFEEFELKIGWEGQMTQMHLYLPKKEELRIYTTPLRTIIYTPKHRKVFKALGRNAS